MLRISTWAISLAVAAFVLANIFLTLAVSNLRYLLSQEQLKSNFEAMGSLQYANSKLRTEYWSITSIDDWVNAWNFFQSETGNELFLLLAPTYRPNPKKIENQLIAIHANHLAREQLESQKRLITTIQNMKPWSNRTSPETYSQFATFKQEAKENRDTFTSLSQVCNAVDRYNVKEEKLSKEAKEFCATRDFKPNQELTYAINNSAIADMVQTKPFEINGGRATSFILIDEKVSSVCNFSPFPAFLSIIYANKIDRKYQDHVETIPPGDCAEISLGYNKAPDFVFMKATPDPQAVSFSRAQLIRPDETKWQDGQSFIPDHPNGVEKFCFMSGQPIEKIIDGKKCNGRVAFYGRVDMSNSVNLYGGPNRIRRAFFDFYDTDILKRAPQSFVRSPESIRAYMKGLYSSLERNATSTVRGSLQVIGVIFCEDDDPLALGVSICSVVNNPPHGAIIPIRPGDRIEKFSGIPIFTKLDLILALDAFSRTHGLKGPATPVYIQVNGEDRKIITFWSPYAFLGCPVDYWYATATIGLNALTLGFLELDPAMYGAVLMIEQFCTEENLVGTIGGSVASLGGIALKSVIRVVLGKKIAKQAAKGFLRLPVVHIALQGMEEFAYVYNTAPPLPPRRPLAQDAMVSTFYGLGLGVALTNAGRVLR